MVVQIIDGKVFVVIVCEKVVGYVVWLKEENGIMSGLVVVFVGEDFVSQVYVCLKGKQIVEVGMNFYEYKMDVDIFEEDLLVVVNQLNNDFDVYGILVQLLLSGYLNEDFIINFIDLVKDVDGFYIFNVGFLGIGQKFMVFCILLGCLMMLCDYYGLLFGMDVVVIGCLNIVGKFMVQFLLGDSCIVIIVYFCIKDLLDVVCCVDIVVVVVGCFEMVSGDWIKEGVIVIDVGINCIECDGKNKFVGDVDYVFVVEWVGVIMLVSGGVGLMIIVCFLVNIVIVCCCVNGFVEFEGFIV